MWLLYWEKRIGKDKKQFLLRLTGLYMLRRLTAARATKKRSRGYAPLCVFSPPHFFAPVKMLRIFLYRAQKNVSYRRNVMRNSLDKFIEKYI